MYLIIIHDLSVQQAWRLCLKCLGLPTHSPTQSVTTDHVYSPQVVWLLHDSVHNDTDGALINYNYSRSRYATITFTWIYYISQMTLRPSVVHFCRYGKWTVISKSIRASCFQNLWGSSVLQVWNHSLKLKIKDVRIQKHVSCCQVGLSLAFTSFTFYLCQDCY